MKFLYDEKQVEKFIDTMLQPLTDDNVYIMLLVARKKWSKEISRSEEFLMHQYIREVDKDIIIRKIRRFEVENVFIDRNTNKFIPANACGLYIDLTPKSVIKGLGKYITTFMEDIINSRYDENRYKRIKKFERMIFSEIHKTNATKKPFLIIDVDKKDPVVLENLKLILDSLSIPIFSIIETHSGYHIFVERGEHLATLYKNLDKIRIDESIEIQGHCQTVIPGTMQGGFKVKLLEVKNEKIGKRK